MAGRLLFIHGAGGDIDDRPLADELATTLALELDYPVIGSDDMSAAAWTAPIHRALAPLDASDRVVAHSFGASMLLRVLGEEPEIAVRSVLLLAMPDWSPAGWDIAEYAFAAEPAVDIALHHCRDDEVVPFGHLALNATGLPHARLHAHTVGGHQFTGALGGIVESLRA